MAPPAVSSDDVLAVLEEAELEARSPAINLASTQLTSSPPSSSSRRSPTVMQDGGLSPITRRSTIHPRGLNKGGIAGVVVGSIIAVCLLGLCFYPFIVRRLKRRTQQAAALHAQDAEAAQVPATTPTTGTLPFAPGASRQNSGTRQSSKDSLSNKDDSLNSTVNPSSKDGAFDTVNDQVAVTHDHQQERGAPVEHENILQRNQSLISRRRGSDDVSLGTHPRWNTEGPPPLSPGGIELVDTRADGLEYSEAMAGQSASYYSPTVPSEAFGMATPPPADEAQFPARSLSRGSSLKRSLMSIMRQLSSKDSGKFSPTGDRESGPWVPSGLNGDRQELSESPIIHDGPSFRDFGYPRGQVPRLATPVRLPMSPASTADTGTHDEGSPEPPARSMMGARPSPPILPPSSPPPGTVNPMDIMAPSNQSEHVFHTDRELYYLTNPHVSPPRKTISPNDQPESVETEASPEPIQAPTPASTEETIVPKTEPQYEMPPAKAPKTPAPQLDQDINMTTGEAPVRYGATHLTPAYQGHGRNSSIATSEGNWTDRSDRSPLPSHVSSNPSHHNTPNTQLTDISPSPRSDMGSDIRSSASPYNGATQIYTCDECSRGFDQIHKLNHHRRYHERPHECPHLNCDKRFGTKTHLDRHINDKHKKTRKFHCLEQACPYSRAGGKGFPRKDNWRRHMINKHGMNPQADPEPDIADDAMTGM